MDQPTNSTLLIDAYQDGGNLLVILKGRMVLENSEAVRARLHALVKPSVTNFYVHMGLLEYVDSAGWGAMVGLKMAALRNQAILTFLAPNDRLLDIFRISKLDSIFELIHGSEAESIKKKIETPESLLWRDTPDESQRRFNTEAYFIANESKSITPGSDNPAEKEAQLEAIAELTQKALDHLRLGDYPKVIEVYQKVLDLDPNDIAALNNLGVVYEKQEEWHEQALDAWTRVLEIGRERGDAKHADRAQRHLQSLGQRLGDA